MAGGPPSGKLRRLCLPPRLVPLPSARFASSRPGRATWTCSHARAHRPAGPRGSHVPGGAAAGPGHEAEVSLSGQYQACRCGAGPTSRRAAQHTGRGQDLPGPGGRPLPGTTRPCTEAHALGLWLADVRARGLDAITLTLVYLDIVTQTEHPSRVRAGTAGIL